MHTLTAISPHRQQRFFQSEPTTFGTGSAKSGSAPLPIDERDSGDLFSWTSSLPPAGECAGYSSFPESISRSVRPHTPCPRINAVSERFFQLAARSPYHPTSAPITSHHASVPRSRLTTAGFQSRRREDFAWSHFFPRSVGFGPTLSKAKGAFTAAPSMLCQAQATPSISSYSASPFRQRRVNTPLRLHSKKYLCTELALPKSFFGNAFHWQPVRSTKMMPSKTFRGSMGLRPPPGCRRYRRFFLRFCFGMSGLTRSQRSSDTVHDLIALMIKFIMSVSFIAIYYLRISTKYYFISGDAKLLIEFPLVSMRKKLLYRLFC